VARLDVLTDLERESALGRGADNDLVHIDVGWLFDCERDSAGDCAWLRRQLRAEP
jgi:hypothetical protein